MSETIPAVFENGVFRPLRRPEAWSSITTSRSQWMSKSRCRRLPRSLALCPLRTPRNSGRSSIVSSSASTPGSGDRVALDTSVAIDVLAAKADARLLAGINEHLLPAPVVGELRYGALNSRKAAENLAKVEALVTRCAVLNVTVTTAKVYAELGLALRQKGKPIPENDLWIAALCVEHQVPLAAVDAHFDAIDDLERWRLESVRSETDAS